MNNAVELRRLAAELSEDPTLWEAIRNGNEGVRAQMVEVHMYLLEAVAVTLSKKLPPHVTLDDLKSYGALGLLRAVDTYDPAKASTAGTRTAFSTHAVIAIRGKILDELRAQDWAPKSLRRRARDMEKAATLLRRSLHREPTDEELADALEVSPEVINRTRLAVQQSTHKSLEDFHPHVKVHREEDISPDEGPEEDSFVSLCQAELATWFHGLEFEEQVIIALYYYENYNLSKIARETGLGETKVISTHTRLVAEFRTRLLAMLDKEGLGETHGFE